MKKLILLASMTFATSAAVLAQNTSGNSNQTVQLSLSNALEISFTSTNASQGNTVTMAFNNADDYANGVESTEQELKIRSNKNFKVGVKIDYNSFSYTGPGNLNLATVPMNAFGLKVTDNSTGGNIAGSFNTTSYNELTGTDQNLIVNGDNGDNQKLAVKYKCTPGFGLPAGTYTFDVVYTATQE